MLSSPRLLVSLDVAVAHGGAAAVFLSSLLHFTLIHAPWVMRRQLMKSTVHIQASSTKDLKHIHRRSSNMKVKRFLAVSMAKSYLTVETNPWCKHRHTFHCKKTLSSKNESRIKSITTPTAWTAAENFRQCHLLSPLELLHFPAIFWAE